MLGNLIFLLKIGDFSFQTKLLELIFRTTQFYVLVFLPIIFYMHMIFFFQLVKIVEGFALRRIDFSLLI